MPPATRNTQAVGQQGSVSKGARPQRNKKKRAGLPRQERTISMDTNTEPKHQPPSTTPNSPTTVFPQARGQARKRQGPQEPEAASNLAQSETLRKQRRTSGADATAKYTYDQSAARTIENNKTDPIAYWSEQGHWPEHYFTQDAQTRKDFENYNGMSWVVEMGLDHLLAEKRSLASFRGRQSETGSTASSEMTRQAKSTPYSRPSYATVLATKGSFMEGFELGITDASKELCRTLLEAEQSVPQDTLFRDDLFNETCQSVQLRNESMVVRDISPLICPSAQVLRIYGATHLKALNESVNEGWNCAKPFYGPRPQPDYSIGFGRSAFTDDQLEKLKPFIGEIPDTCISYFMATFRMHFPFLTCETKCGASTLDIADRQNAHSMTLAVRGIVELFRIVKREKELHREILAFSISHDHQTVRIFGHYPVLDGDKTTFYRHKIYAFDFTALDGKEKWTAYRFTKNVYDIWMPAHLRRICSAVNDLQVDFKISQQSEVEESGIQRGLETRRLPNQKSHDAASLDEAGTPSSPVGSRDLTTDTSLSHRIDGGESKRPRKRGRPA